MDYKQILLVIIVILILYCSFSGIIEPFIETSNKLPIYIISLEKDVERRTNIGVIPEYYYAVHGETVDTTKLNIDTKIGRDLRKGEIGCYLSHVQALNKAYLSNSPFVLVLEDDSKIKFDNTKELIDEINKIIEVTPDDWEFLFLGNTMYEEDKILPKSENSDYHIKHVSFVIGMFGYLINVKNLTKEKIDNVFQIDKPIEKPFDNIIGVNFKTYLVEPMIIEHDYSYMSNTHGIV